MKRLLPVTVASAVLLPAQNAPPRPKNTYHSSDGASQQPRLVSPEVNPDRTIAFRLCAPEANQVSLSFHGIKPMTKSADGASIVEVPGNPPRFDQIQPVPHGALQIRTYTSTSLKRLRTLNAYTPPQYDAEPNRCFPVLYLRHGGGDTEENWSDTGRAGVIVDNLIAQRKAVPTIIVMPNGDNW
jgi:hypothetical protein